MSLNTKAFGRQSVDIEWLQLVLMARQLGLTIEEIRSFLTTTTTNSARDYPRDRPTTDESALPFK